MSSSTTTLPKLQIMVRQFRLKQIGRLLTESGVSEDRKNALFEEFMDLLERSVVLPFCIPFKKGWADLSTIILGHAFLYKKTKLEQFGWQVITKNNIEALKQFVEPQEERTFFKLDEQLEQSLKTENKAKRALSLKLAGHHEWYTTLQSAIETSQFEAFSKMPGTPYTQIGYLAQHTHHLGYLQGWIETGIHPDDILVPEPIKYLIPSVGLGLMVKPEEYCLNETHSETQVTFLTGVCIEAILKAHAKAHYVVDFLILPLSLVEKAAFALDLGADLNQKDDNGLSPLNRVHRAIKETKELHGMPHLEPLLQIGRLFDDHLLKQELVREATRMDDNEKRIEAVKSRL